MQHLRKQVWIDRFQTFLSLRIACYFLLYQAVVWTLVLLERHMLSTLGNLIGAGGASACLVFVTLTVIFFGLVFIWDAVKFVHRVVGPIYRFRKTMQAIAAGETVERIRLRKGDFLLEFQDDFNEMLEALQERGAIVLKPAETVQERAASL